MGNDEGIHYNADGSASAFVGRPAVEVFAAFTLAQALRLFHRTGIKASRLHTPKRMRQEAERITGRKFKARDYLAMADALTAWAQQQRDDLPQYRTAR